MVDRNAKIILILALIAGLGCAREESNEDTGKRWYTPAQVEAGRGVFEKHCAICHGRHAEGAREWKRTLPDGSYPPPPLNGTAHAWHHPLPVLKRTIDEGGVPSGGRMPGLKGRLTDEESFAAIAFFQSRWSGEIYREWLERGGG